MICEPLEETIVSTSKTQFKEFGRPFLISGLLRITPLQPIRTSIAEPWDEGDGFEQDSWV